MSRSASESVAGLAAAAGIAILMSFCYLAINAIPRLLNPDIIREHIASTFATNPAAISGRKSVFLDCEILSMAADPGSNGVSPRQLWGIGGDAEDPCDGAREIALGHPLDPTKFTQDPYHQYWWGNRMAITTALRFLNVEQVQTAGTVLVYLAGLISMLLHILAARKDPARRQVHFALAIMCASLLLCWDLPDAASSFRSLPNNVILFVVLGLAGIWNPTRLSVIQQAVVFGAFGSIVVYFDLFDGPIPLGMICVLLLFSASTPNLPVKEELRHWISGVVWFCCGIAVTVAMKILLVTTIADHQFVAKFFDLLIYRINGSPRVMVDAQVRSKFVQRHVTVMQMVTTLLHEVHVLGFGRTVPGLAILGTALTGLLAGLVALAKDSLERNRALIAAFVAAAVPILLWYFFFREHTQSHSIHEIRESAWLVGAGFSVWYLLAVSRKRA